MVVYFKFFLIVKNDEETRTSSDNATCSIVTTNYSICNQNRYIAAKREYIKIERFILIMIFLD